MSNVHATSVVDNRNICFHLSVLRLPLNLVILCSLFSGPSQIFGQITGPCAGSRAENIACLAGTVIDRANQKVGFRNNPQVSTGNGVLVIPLASSLPLPSPASGFTYSFDSTGGGYVRSSQSFGPILAERAETIGRNKLAVGVAFQRFVFDEVDGVDIHQIETSLLPLPGILVKNTSNISLQLNQVTSFATYGINDRVDLSVAVPISTVHFGIAFSSVVRAADTGLLLAQTSGAGSHSVTGLGDVNLQVKGTIHRWEHASVAFGTTLRLPTCDQYEALGAGAVGIRPFIAVSSAYKRISPHVNLGYQWNGESLLAGNILTGTKLHIPSQIQYAAGVDAGVLKRLTLNFDVIGFEAIHTDRLPFLPNAFAKRSLNVTNGAVGFKFNPVGKLLVVCDLLFRMNDGGLRFKVAPLIGLTYGF